MSFPLKYDATFSAEPRSAYCPKHGKVFNWIEVEYAPGYSYNGRYCLKCYVENVLVPSCGKLSEVER